MGMVIDKNTVNNIRTVYKTLLESWNSNDATAFANLFTESANVIGFDGSQMNGRKQIRDELTRIFQDHQVATYVGIIKEIRNLNENIYLLRAVVGMLPPGKDEIKPDVNAIQTLIVVRTGNDFKIEAYQNTAAAFHGRPELSKQLTEELQQVADKHVTTL